MKVEVDGEILHTAADGNGPVHALDLALRKALGAFYPALDGVHLVDYKVRIIDGDAATAARTRVIIETGHQSGTWITAGADANIITASLAALHDSFEYAIWQLDARPERRDELVSSRVALGQRPQPGGSLMTAVEPSAAQGDGARRAAVRRSAPGLTSRAPWCRSNEANVSLATHALNYGTSVFEGIRAYRQDSGGLSVLFGHEHYERLLRNARLLRASVPESADDLLEITLELLRRNEHDGDAYVRPIIYKAAHSIRVQLSDLEDRIGIFTIPLGDYLPTGGIRVTVSGWQRVSDNAIPGAGKDRRLVRECRACDRGRPRRGLRRCPAAHRRWPRGRGIRSQHLRRLRPRGGHATVGR